jgi:hypothetical protein
MIIAVRHIRRLAFPAVLIGIIAARRPTLLGIGRQGEGL